MRIRTALLLAAALLALCLGTAPARGAGPHGGLDRSFGHSGITTAFAPKSDNQIRGFTVLAGGRSYVLDGSVLLALKSNGRPARGFGKDGQVTIAPAGSEGEPAGLAVDSAGRLLVAGSTRLDGKDFDEAYVIRFMPDGARDAGFGSAGEVDTDFGLPVPSGREAPSVVATSILIDAQGRPIVGGSFGSGDSCGYGAGGGPAPFVARLTDSGAVDRSFAGTGYAAMKGPGGVSSLAPLPAGGSAVFTTPCSTGARVEWQAPLYSTLTESGGASPIAKEHRLPFSYLAPLIDPNGCVVELASPQPAAEGPDSLARSLPNGDLDPSFGHQGTVVLGRGRAFAVDAESRPIVAAGTRKIELRRYLQDGSVDQNFGPGGRLTAKGRGPDAIGLDARGRIYTVSTTRTSSRTTVEVARFIPGS